MKFLLAVLFGTPLAAAVILRAFGDPFATSIAAGFVALFVLQHIAARTATRPAPRKADPAKIERLERELGIAEPPPRMVPFTEEIEGWDGETVKLHGYRPASEAPTTPFEHPRMDPATFHGAPTFGHKIEGP